MRRARVFAQVAGAIADGTEVDWSGIDSRTEETDQAVVAQLRTLAALSLLNRGKELPDRPEQEYWGHLRVLEHIGRGAFGEVYRAWDTRLDREVALKLLPPDSVRAGSSASSTIEEGRLLARVRHPNVVTIYGAERIDGRIGLWMEFVKGRTLEEVLRDGKTYTTREVTRIGIELCRAVSAVHAAGLLHRDIKAHNVMVADADGRLVLMDFGTGRELDRSETNIAGTPLYLSPEVLSGAPATTTAEVYSIGVLLYHLLTGAYPVHARDVADLRRAHAQGERTGIRSVRPDVPQRLARVIERAIESEPDRRFDSAESLRAALATVERAPSLLRTVYITAAALVLTAAGWIVWDAGARAGIPSTSSGAAVAAGAIWGSEIPVIAVLPFKNLSSAPDSDYFVDGLTEEIINNLAVIDGLQVRSETSSFFFKNKPRDLAQIGEQLRVNLIVAGSVQRDGTRLRINAQLVQVAGDVPLWSDQFDRSLEDVFTIQDEISRAIVNKLRLTLGRGQRRYQTNVEAYELYLRARALVGRRGTANAQQAAKLFEQVIAKDPAFAPAHAGLADAYAFMSWQIPGLSSEEGLRRMRPAAMKAIELDPLLAEAHAAIGQMYSRELDWAKAEKSFRRAIELNSSLTQVHEDYASSTLLPLGKSTEALWLLERALQADPLSMSVWRGLAGAQIHAGRYDEAIANARRILAVDPDFPHANLLLARALALSGRSAEAVAVRAKYGSTGEIWLAQAYMMSGRRTEVERMARAHEHPYRLAVIYAAMGDTDRTFEALNRAVDIMPQRTALLLAHPEMALLRGDPRLLAVRKRLKLP